MRSEGETLTMCVEYTYISIRSVVTSVSSPMSTVAVIPVPGVSFSISVGARFSWLVSLRGGQGHG